MTVGAARKEIQEGLLVRQSSLTGTWARSSWTPSSPRVKLRSQAKQSGFPEREFREARVCRIPAKGTAFEAGETVRTKLLLALRRLVRFSKSGLAASGR